MLTEDMANIYVGPKRKKFHLHKELLCARSGYFTRSLAGDFKEREEKAVYLPDDDVASFELLVLWIYGSKLKAPGNSEELSRYLAVYVMGEKFFMEGLRNAITDSVKACYLNASAKASPEQLEYLYNNTSATCQLRLLAARTAAMDLYGRTKHLPDSLRELIKKCPDFAADFAEALLRFSAGEPRYLSREKDCEYHEHQDGKSCV